MVEPPPDPSTLLVAGVAGRSGLEEQHADTLPAALAQYHALLRATVEAGGGRVFKTAGDIVYAAFPTALGALVTAVAVMARVQAAGWPTPAPLPVRIALYSSPDEAHDDDEVTSSLQRAARLLAAASSGQVLLSRATQERVRGALPPGVTLQDLGEHHLPDLSRPEQIFGVRGPGLPPAFPPILTLDSHPNNLPVWLTPLIGRQAEIRALLALNGTPGVRLVTLTGPGGTGKTRLGVQAAAALLDAFAAGVFFVNLAPIGDPALLPGTIVTALGLREGEGLPATAQLHATLRDKQMLLLLDSFEHVAAAAPEVAALLAAAPRLAIWITSRVALHIYGEHEFAVPPLALPDPRHLPPLADLETVEAVQLFVTRARAAQAGFALTADNARAIVEICRRLDGLPLAIELAAARVRTLPPSAMRTRLNRRLQLLTGGARDLPARQQTLRATLAWSHDLLAPAEQTLFRRLGVFEGGWTLDAAEAAGDNPQWGVLDGLESLIGKSLLSPMPGGGDDPRFTMLETIREYARERLAESGEGAAIAARHAAYFCDLVEQIEPRLTSPERLDWLERLETEHDNLRGALAWSLSAVDGAELGLRLAGALAWFWYFRGHLREGRDWLERTLARAREVADSRVQGKAQIAAGALAHMQSDYPIARTRLSAGLEQCRQAGDIRGLAYGLGFLSQVAARQGDAAARGLAEESCALFRQSGDTWGLALACDFLGQVAGAEGHVAEGRALHGESLRLFRALGDTWGMSIELGSAGHTGSQQGDYTAARADLEAALTVQRLVGDQWNMAWSLRNLGDVFRYQGDVAAAMTRLEESLALFREVADGSGIASVLYVLGCVALQQGALAAAGAYFRESVEGAVVLQDAGQIVRGYLGLAAVAGALGLTERAGLLAGAAAAVAGVPRGGWTRAESAQYLYWLRTVRAGAGPILFQAARRRGRALAPAAALALALQALPIGPGPPPAAPLPVVPPALAGPGHPAHAAHAADALTPRETDVLRLVAEGLTDAEVAARLVLSPRTVQVHLRSVYSKLAISTRSAATRYAIQQHLA